MLARRVAVAAVGVPLVVGLVRVGGWPFFVLVAGFLLVSLGEYLRLITARGLEVPARAARLALVGLLAGSQLAGVAGRDAVTFGFVVYLFIIHVWRGRTGNLEESAHVLLGWFYVGWLGSHLVLLRGLPGGYAYTLLALGLGWGFDTCAYFAGRRWGRRRMCPAVSAGKTWEGAVIGGVATILAGMALGAALGLPWPFVVAAALLAVPAAQAGDLAESVVKRYAGAKDAGSILPGHGGVLDRIDSILFVVPLIYYLVRFMPG